MRTITTILMFATLVVALPACGNHQTQTELDTFIAKRPMLSLPLDVGRVPLTAQETSKGWTERECELIEAIFGGCDSLWVFDPDELYPISEVYRIPATDFGLPEQSNINVLLVTSNSHTQGILPRRMLVILHYSAVIDAKLLDDGQLTIYGNYIECTHSTIDSTGCITLVRDINKHPIPFGSNVITHATYRIDQTGHFQEVRTEGTHAVSHRSLMTDSGYLTDEFTWGKQPADSTHLPQRMNEKNRYFKFEYDDGNYPIREEPYYEGELLYYLEQIYTNNPREGYFEIEKKYEFRTQNNNTIGVWVAGFSWEDEDESGNVEFKPMLVSFIASNEKLIRVERNSYLPASIYSYYDATISPSGTIALRGSALDLCLRPTNGEIIVDSLVFFDTNLDSLGNTYTTAAPFGKADLPGLKGKPNTLTLEELSDTYLKTLSYHFRPLTELNPSYDAAADYRSRMKEYFSKIIRNDLPHSFDFLPSADNYEEPESIPDYLTSFFTSQGGMGERTNFRMTQLTSPYMMQTLLLVSCYHKDQRELYLYTIDQWMNVLHQLPICSIPRIAEHYYACNIEATAVNTLTITITPRETDNEQMRVLTIKIDSKGRLIQQ